MTLENDDISRLIHSIAQHININIVKRSLQGFMRYAKFTQ